ncbi:MAG TPA: MOSC N-terminal beta barrel domain-containing protein [Bacilli bacterium]
MNLYPIGEIREIMRYAVKSFAGERLDEVTLKPYGIYGDRSHAFIDETKDGWYRYVTARQIPEMLGYQAAIVHNDSYSEYPQLKVTSPDGRRLQWDDQLLKEIQLFSKQKISMEHFNSLSEQTMAMDDGSILIITDKSHNKIEQVRGMKIDHRRFRANFYIKLFDEFDLQDADFIGKRLVIGDAELSVISLCERCSLISIDPSTLERDPILLDKVREHMNLNFGMYVEVEKVGTIKVGDQVYLVY